MTDWQPTPKQRDVLDAATNAGLRRSITAVCRTAKVSREAFYGWYNDDPHFRDAWEQVWHGAIRRHLPGVVAAMIERAQSGDVSAARLVSDLAGVIVTKSQQEQSGTVTVIVEYADADN